MTEYQRKLKRALLLYKRFKTETREYGELAEYLGYSDIGQLNKRCWHIVHTSTSVTEVSA